MLKRYEVYIDIEGECGENRTYKVLSGNVVPVTSDCIGTDKFIIEVNDDSDREFSIEYTCGKITQVKTYKVCENAQDCPACNDCIGNVCVLTCDKVCYNNDCVDCTSDINCPDGMICVGFTCMVPPGKKVCEDGSIARDCPEDCTNCETYDGNECVPKICPDSTECLEFGEKSKNHCFDGECVECLIASDCGVNQVCKDNTCECAPGFILDLVTQECVPDYDCHDTNDCPDCFFCSGGKCLPVICPQGYICIGGNCVETCTGDFDCPGGICVDGICEDGDPPCPPDPCTSPADCGVGCGCDNTCVECAAYSCLENIDCPNGCACDGGTCTGIEDPDPDPDCSQFDCLTGECDQYVHCECDGNLNCVPIECEDDLTIEKLDCGIRSTFVGNSKCPCPEIGLGNKITITGTSSKTVKIDFELRKGTFGTYNDFLGNPLLSQTGVINELPSAGGVRVSVRTTYRRSDINGVPIGQTFDSNTVIVANVLFINTDSGSIQTTVEDIGSVVVRNSDTWVVTNVVIIREQVNQFEFQNGCRYETNRSFIYSFSSGRTLTQVQNNVLPVGDGASYINSLVFDRPPLLTLFKKSLPAGVYQEVVANYGATFDAFYPYAEQYKYFKVSSDCGCVEDKEYTCTSGNANRMVFCNLGDFYFDAVDCGKGLQFVMDVTESCDAIIAAPTRYRLLADGIVIIPERLIQPSGVIFQSGEYVNVGFVYNEITIEVIGDECEECAVTMPAPPYVLNFTLSYPTDITVGCDEDEEFDLNINVQGGVPDFNFIIYRDGNLIDNGSFMGNSTAVSLPVTPGEYSVQITDSNGCSNTKNFSFDPNITTNPFGVTVEYECSEDEVVYTITSTSTEQVELRFQGDEVDGTYLFTETLELTMNRIDGENVTITVSDLSGNCPDFVWNDVIECCPTSITSGITPPSYTCEDGLVLDAVEGVSYEVDNQEVLGGERYNPSEITVVLFYLGCEREYILQIPTCYDCVAETCIPSVDGEYSTSNCDNVCNPEENPCEPTTCRLEFTVGGGEGCDLESVEIVDCEVAPDATYGNLFVLTNLEPTEQNWEDFGVDFGAGTLGVWDLTCDDTSFLHLRILVSREGCPDEWVTGFYSCDFCDECEPCLEQLSYVPSSRLYYVVTSAGTIDFTMVNLWLSAGGPSAGDNPAILLMIQTFLDNNDPCGTPTNTTFGDGGFAYHIVNDSGITFTSMMTSAGVFPYEQNCFIP